MSRFYDAIRGKGFAVVVSPPRNDPELVAAAFEAGADAVKLHINVRHRASGNEFGPWSDERDTILACMRACEHPGPVGIMPGADTVPSQAEMNEILEAGMDFFDIYDKHCPAWMLALPTCAMVAVGHDFRIERVKALSRLGMDVLEASIVDPADYGKDLSVYDLENYWLLCQATERPVVVPSQKRLRPDDLPMLRETGVKGVMLGTISLGDSKESFLDRLPAFIENVR